MSAIVTVQNVEKSFGSRRVLAGVSFAVHERDRIGIIGVNGSGKSTLMRILVGGPGALDDAALPDAGLVTRRRDLALEYVPQEPRLDGTRTVQETLREGLRALEDARTRLEALEAELSHFAGDDARLDTALATQAALHERIDQLGGWDMDYEIRGLAASLSLPPLTALVEELSIGERRRVALARALLSRPDLLALDEPTNHLDARTVEWLEARLGQLPGALLLVTHDRYFLDQVATRILELDRGQLYSYEGNYRRFLEKQAERLDVEEDQERARAQFVRRELDWIRRGPKARGTKQKARIDRFDDAVAARPGAADKRSGPIALRLPSGGRLGKTILELRGLSKSLGGRLLFRDLTLIMKPGDRIGLVGPNGAGKTTLVRTILGEIAPDAGQAILGINTRISFLDQGRADLRDDLTVLEEVAGDGDQVFLEDGPVHVRTFLRMLLFEDAFADTPIGVLSGGERNRVQLAKLLRGSGNLLILDEPTNDLDLMTLGVLEEALSEFPACALIVSHDRWFLDRVATAILAFEPDKGAGTVTLYEGNYSSYLERRRAVGPAVLPAAGERKPDAQPPKPTPSSGPRKLSYKEQQELKGMTLAIVAAEARAEELQAALNDPALYKERSIEVPGLVAALDAVRAEIEALYDRWGVLDEAER